MDLSPILQDAASVVEFPTEFDAIFGGIQPENVRRSLFSALDGRCTRLVIEETYVDREYTAAYYIQGGRAFTPREKNVRRVHFFRGSVTPKILDSCEPGNTKLLDDAYLGFAVVRPDRKTLGRTILAPPDEAASVRASHGAKARFRVSLMGHRLSVLACPYISQDQQVTACASASIWMATTPVSMKDEDSQGRSTVEITRLANGMQRGYSPTIGGAGLSFEQMSRALIDMGYDPLGIEAPEPVKLKKMITAYCDSGFAPILIVLLDEGPGIPKDAIHAMTLVGHLDGSGKYMLRKGEDQVVELPEHKNDLVIHDDQQGLYLRADLVDSTDPDAPTRVVFQGSSSRSGGRVLSVLIPVPNRIMTDVVAVVAGAQRRLNEARDRGHLEDRAIRLRPILVRSRDYKENLPADMSEDLKSIYRRLPMPRYVWLVELSFADDAGSVFGEILFDSTTPTRWHDDFLSEHFVGQIAGLAVSGHEFDDFRIPLEDARYDPFQPMA
jgi:hypothetical protein